MGKETREIARSIELPFPCGCLVQHAAPNGFKVSEHTCNTHDAIDRALVAERERAILIITGGVTQRVYHELGLERVVTFIRGEEQATDAAE